MSVVYCVVRLLSNLYTLPLMNNWDAYTTSNMSPKLFLDISSIYGKGYTFAVVVCLHFRKSTQSLGSTKTRPL